MVEISEESLSTRHSPLVRDARRWMPRHQASNSILLSPFLHDLAPCTMGTIVRIVRKRLPGIGPDSRASAERVSRLQGDHTTMSRSRPFASLPSTRGLGALIVAFAVVGSALSTPPVALAQFGGQSAVAQEIKIKSPVASQVFQRNVNGRAVIPVALDEVPDFKAPAVATALAAAAAASPAPARSPRPSPRPRLAPEREPGHSSAPAKLYDHHRRSRS